MSYEITLTDNTGSATLPALNPPLSEEILEGAVDVVTLDMSMYTDFTAKKRQWTQRWAYMTEANYNILKGYYNRQFSTGSYPQVTITELGVSAVYARLSLSPQQVIDNCGKVQNVILTMREA